MVYYTLPFWENPEIQEINRLPMSSPLIPFASAREAVADALAGPEYRNLQSNSLYQSLDGAWEFKLAQNPREDLPGGQDDCIVGSRRPPAEDLLGWINPDYDVSAWASIKVPGAWARQGGDEHYNHCFDKPHYTDVTMPFKARPPKSPEKNPTGLYRRSFTIPPAWKERRTVLHIGSAESAALVYVNGFFTGAGKDSRLPQEFDISLWIQEGDNLLCIKVPHYSDASYIEDQDHWWLGGIHRSVFLYSTGKSYIKDIKAIPGAFSTDDEKNIGKNTGKLNITFTLGGKIPVSDGFGYSLPPEYRKESPFVVAYNLYPFSLPQDAAAARNEAKALTAKGGVVSGKAELKPDYNANSDSVEVELVVENPAIWSHEHPNLYILETDLYRDGNHIESVAFCTGFRNLAIANRELRINDKMVYIKGVNRHEHDEKTGKTVSVESMVRDIRLMKSYNFNAVRTSHYPNDEAWYELCDRYGIYLLDEADIEHHAYYDQLCDDTAWTNAYLSRIERMAERDKNHPSVIIWSLGNESGWGGNHNAGAAWLRWYDPSRPLNYEGAVRPRRKRSPTMDSLNGGGAATDLVSPMYQPVEFLTEFIKTRSDERPLIMIEYSSSMGNSNGSLMDYWKAIESHHGLQGGFIWQWMDHGLEAYSGEGVRYWKYGGDFGDLPSDFECCCNGLLWPDGTPKPAMEECRQVQAPARLLPIPGKPLGFIVENRFDFSTLDCLKLAYTICEDDPSGGPGKEKRILKQGTLGLPPLGPGEKQELDLGGDEFSFSTAKGAVYFYGEFRLASDTPWAKAGQVAGRAGRLLREAPPVWTDLPAAAGISAAADASAVNRAGPESLAEFAARFKPSLYRVPTQNDGFKTFMQFRNDPETPSYHFEKVMYQWIDLDLLHVQTANEKNQEILWEGRPAVRYSVSLLAGAKAAPKYQKYQKTPGLGTYTLVTVKPRTPGESLIMDLSFDLNPMLPELPRIGISAQVPAYYNEISWFGAGPHESYPDRRAAAFLGRYRHTVAELETPYIMPQENGNRGAVRNLTLIAENAPPGKPAALTISAASPVNFSCSRYTKENLWEALHTIDLRDTTKGPAGYYTLNIDIAQRGVGTAACGPDAGEEYRVRPGIFTMRLYLK
jgi:beta-galactosidase